MQREVEVIGVAAFCDGNMAIGKNRRIPWPHIKEDYDFYMGLCLNTKDPKKKNGILMGRNGWNTWKTEGRLTPKTRVVVTSTTLPEDETQCLGVARSFDEAIKLFSSSPEIDDIENIYVLGGGLNYELCVTDPRCRKLIMTRIYQDFDADVFFPQFEHAFHRISDPEIDDRIREDPTTGIKFRFEVWEKNVSA